MKEQPETDDITEWFLRAFNTISMSRQYSQSIAGANIINRPQPITLTELKAYVDLHEIIVEKTEFVKVMQSLDALFIERSAQ